MVEFACYFILFIGKECPMSNWSPDVFKEAWNVATRYHQGQTYGGPAEGEQIPYLNHIASVVMEIIWALPTDPALDSHLAIQCALLHDLLEDTPATYELVQAQFGTPVADGVLALTKDVLLPTKELQMADSLRRIQLQRKEIWMVKLADRITNLHHPPFYWDNAKILAYQQEARQIYTALHTANAALAERLHLKITQYTRYLRQGDAAERR
jgi:(p)ppGpp synthase/HD superfamily hydrolase